MTGAECFLSNRGGRSSKKALGFSKASVSQHLQRMESHQAVNPDNRTRKP